MIGRDNTSTKTGPLLSALFLFVRKAFSRRERLGGFGAVLLAVFALSACTAENHTWKLSGPTMGTAYHITVVDVPAAVHKAELQSAIDAELAAVNQEMSTYIPDSELMRFNRAPVGEVVEVSPHLAEVVARALEIHRHSDGAFDVTVGPLVNLWGFGPNPEPETIPGDEEIAALQSVVGSDALNLQGTRLSKARAVAIDLSAIAKGHGVDRVADLLEDKGIGNYLVEVGGELRTAGVNPKGKPWRIGIERPSAGQVVQKPIEVIGKAVATSGDYRNYYERDGKRYAHTIDPRTGRPVEHKLASVTVIADSCAEADGYATALNVIGAEAALKLAEERQLAVFLLVKTDSGFEERASSAFQPYLESQGR
ncbi:FAD:protein FMN transferase [Microbulbifer hydrolyticus]|uniref:FAD:protein FMN transferase n=1 Tax=Microbulbifer hydrolyticus TaxID=48074 RepID=A0A6P1TBG0_9GAMM|nr:FAD:protein FMN transferase [Microbulbifer hydrolyticus]MBB5210554.1 thiamine biosynthesis lipoprotein [Microbulbifer hydrolyticus]QHQ38976.1 FAD:protein FMN transferase [Microbulbifer hydrolyticus]